MWQSILAIIHRFRFLLYVGLGVCGGLFLPSYSVYCKPFAHIFIQALKCVAIPLVFLSCLNALTSLQDVKVLKKLGPRILAYYVSTSFLASTVGSISCLFFISQQGASLDSNPNHQSASFIDFITRLVPSSFFTPFVEGNLLQILIIALILGITFLSLELTQQKVLRPLCQASYDWIQIIVGHVIRFTPIASFFLAYDLVANVDMSDLWKYQSFLWALIIASTIHACITLPILLKIFTGTSVINFVRHVYPALFVALTTASSSGTLPVSQNVLEKNVGVSKQTSSLVLPLGATVNMDGSAVYQAQLLLFMCILSGQNLTSVFVVQTILLVLLSSAGTAGIPGGGVAMMSLMITTLGLPIEYLALYILLDRVLDYPITAMNVWGDLIGARIIDTIDISTNDLENNHIANDS